MAGLGIQGHGSRVGIVQHGVLADAVYDAVDVAVVVEVMIE
jgi:hypothetical protein